MIKTILKKARVSAKATDLPILDKVFRHYSNRFELNEDIKTYCIQNGIDCSYLGIATGSFYQTVSRRDPSYSKLKKLGILNPQGKDSYANHLVIPELKGGQIVSLEFIPLASLAPAKEESNQLRSISKDSFSVSFDQRTYLIQGLRKKEHQLKATLKVSVGKKKHVDVINFYSSGNRKRLIKDIVENFALLKPDIVSDIYSLMDLCENYNVRSFSANAKAVLATLEEYGPSSSATIQEILLWNHMKVFRSLQELTQAGVIEKDSTKRPNLFKTSLDLQELNKEHEL